MAVVMVTVEVVVVVVPKLPVAGGAQAGHPGIHQAHDTCPPLRPVIRRLEAHLGARRDLVRRRQHLIRHLHHIPLLIPGLACTGTGSYETLYGGDSTSSVIFTAYPFSFPALPAPRRDAFRPAVLQSVSLVQDSCAILAA